MDNIEISLFCNNIFSIRIQEKSYNTKKSILEKLEYFSPGHFWKKCVSEVGSQEIKLGKRDYLIFIFVFEKFSMFSENQAGEEGLFVSNNDLQDSLKR